MMVQRWRISSNSQLKCLAYSVGTWCLWWFKDEEFQAIHNGLGVIADVQPGVYDGSKMKNFKQFTTSWFDFYQGEPVFMMVQRWRISSNSQQSKTSPACSARCLWWFKDEEFQAIHNGLTGYSYKQIGVYDGSKMKNFKQFTTYLNRCMITSWCLWWFKDEEFQAIHNEACPAHVLYVGVYDGSKMKNFKQFTTSYLFPYYSFMVFMMVQRWRISSNSQPYWLSKAEQKGCLWWFKDEEFQAIHNRSGCDSRRTYGVYDGSKMKNFKQFTTIFGWNIYVRSVFMMVQRWRISSNSQHLNGRISGAPGVYDGSKMKNFKQFTTKLSKYALPLWVFMMVQRWRISSNSQRPPGYLRVCERCLWWFKDEEFQAIHNKRRNRNKMKRGVYDGSKMKNFKQFTTDCCCNFRETLVFMMVQRWRISSNSQQSSSVRCSGSWCLWWFKDEEFQAIHNYLCKLAGRAVGVYDGSKMKNFKQFTTGCRQTKCFARCLWWFKDEEFQAIHNKISNQRKRVLLTLKSTA